jgi:hypothetical protein
METEHKHTYRYMKRHLYINKYKYDDCNEVRNDEFTVDKIVIIMNRNESLNWEIFSFLVANINMEPE